MIGSIITFLIVCGMVGIYMAIVHSFLRESERSTEEVQVPPPSANLPLPEAHIEQPRNVRWAH